MMKANLNIMFSMLAFIIFNHPLAANEIMHSHLDTIEQLDSHSSNEYFAIVIPPTRDNN